MKRGSAELLRVGESIPEELLELWKEEEELDRLPTSLNSFLNPPAHCSGRASQRPKTRLSMTSYGTISGTCMILEPI